MGSVTIVGGGYAGSLLARLLDPHVEVTLIEPRDAFIHNVAAMRAVVDPGLLNRIVLPYGGLLKRGKVIRDRAIGLEGSRVRLASGGEVLGDRVVAATGSTYASPFKPATETSADFKTAVLGANAALRAASRIAIVGAGAVGIELAGEIAAAMPSKDVTLINDQAGLLPAFPVGLGLKLEQELRRVGVSLVQGRKVEGHKGDPGEVVQLALSDGSTLEADLVFWAVGTRVDNRLLVEAGAKVGDALGRVSTDPWLRPEGWRDLFLLGDLAGSGDQPTIVAAMRQAPWLADLIRKLDAGAPIETLKPYAPYPLQPILVPVGPKGGATLLPFGPQGLVVGPFLTSAIKGKSLFIPRYRKDFGLAD
jgi:NADH dehydrogenase FAD-containing subunit